MLCRELAVGQLSELRDSLELSQQGPIPRDLTCLIRLFKRVFTLWLFWVLVVTYGLQSTQSKYAALVASMRGGISVLDQESNRVPCTGRRILNHWTTGKSLIQRLEFKISVKSPMLFGPHNGCMLKFGSLSGSSGGLDKHRAGASFQNF